MYKDKFVTVFAYSNNHIKMRFQLEKYLIENYPDIQMNSFSFCINTIDNKKIVYTGDIANVQELNSFIDGTDLLLTEMAHITEKKSVE